MSPRSSCEPQLAQTRVESLARELDAVQRVCEQEERGLRDAVVDEDPAAEVRAVQREHLRMDEALRNADGEEADGDEHDAEERVDGGEVRALRSRVDREAQHEVGTVEEEKDEEEHELVFPPEPPVPPGDLRPDGAGEQHECPEYHPLVHGDVTLEIGELIPLPEIAKRLPRSGGEARVRGEGDGHVEIEDALREALVRVVRGDVEHERERGRHEHEGCDRQGGNRDAIQPEHRPHYSVTTYSKVAQHSKPKSTS